MNAAFHATRDIAEFTRRRQGGWTRLEELLGRLEKGGPGELQPREIGELASLYRRIGADLSYARTHFHGAGLVSYLNNLALRSHGAVHAEKERSEGRLAAFFGRELPEAYRRCLPLILSSVFLFALSGLYGFFISLADPAWGEELLGGAALEALKSGRMWTDALVRREAGALTAFLAANNAGVAFTAFALGATCGVGTALIVAANGYLLGVAAAVTWRYGLAAEFWSFIAAHGPLELSVVFTAGGAGLFLGGALLSPGEAPRGVAFRRAARVAVRLAVGGAIFLIPAGILEAYVSPGDLFPVWFKALLGLFAAGVFHSYMLLQGRGA